MNKYPELKATELIEKFGKELSIKHCEILLIELSDIKRRIYLTVGVSWVSEKINFYDKVTEIIKSK